MSTRHILAGTLLAVLAACSSQSSSPQPAASNPQSSATNAKATAPSTDEEKIKLATSAAPADISAKAAVAEMGADGKMRQLRAGSNGWLCMPSPQVMCLDRQWQNWADAWMNKTDPKISAVGVAYMLQGDTGASNTDPFAMAATPQNQWVVSPAHIMVLTPDVAQLDALPTDPHSGGPWVMWKGTKYAHIMVPMSEMPTGMQ